MKSRNLYQSFIFLLVVFLSGCAGTDFKRPDPQQLTIGKSSHSDVLKVMGNPYQTGEALKNNQKIKTIQYAYANTGGTSKYPDVTPARGLTFSTFDDRLVAQEFVSSFSEDATDFDDSKIMQIIKGKSSYSEVISLLGKPSGEVIYPIIKNKDGTGIVYGYNQVKGSVFNMKFYSKLLIISFDANAIVTDVDYSSSGEK